MEIPPSIFRAYDIRGVAGEHLSPDVYQTLGLGFGTYLRTTHPDVDPTVVVGHDARLNSSAFHDAFVAGLVEAGGSVVDIGMVPTPVVYFAQKALGTNAAAVVTASHNPKEYNGLKLRYQNIPVFGDALRAIHAIIRGGQYTRGAGERRSVDITQEYIDAITRRVHLRRPLTIVVDTGNGAAGPVVTRLFRALGCSVIERNTRPDGTFPNHVPDPTVRRFMRELSDTVTATQADAGIGLDGDGDRIGAVDESGRLWPGDRLLRLFARDTLQRYEGTPVVFDVKCSQTLVDDIAGWGGRPVMSRTGYPFIVLEMMRTGARLGGEMSGHIYFADQGFDDGLYCGARLLELLSRHDGPMSRLTEEAPVVSTPEIRMPCDDEKKFRIVESIKRYYRGKRPLIEIDGARITFDEGWALIRASNTEPVLVLRAESCSESSLQDMFGELEKALMSAGASSLSLHDTYLESR